MMTRFADAFATIWDTFWGRKAPECFVTEAVKIPDPKTLNLAKDETKFSYLKLPNGVKFPCGLGQILITKTYLAFYKELCEEDSRWKLDIDDPVSHLLSSHSSVMSGQPGIGIFVIISLYC